MKINSWIMVLNVEHRTMKLLEDSIKENIGDLWFGDDFSYNKGMTYERKLISKTLLKF
jgi:hypothetical protein